MDINKITLQQFKELPVVKDGKYVIDAIILIPSTIKHDSGYNYYSAVLCFNGDIIGKTDLYDTYSIFTKEHDMIGIDCLSKSGLMRIFFGDMTVTTSLHMIKWEDKQSE